MAHFKLNDTDETFLRVAPEGTLIFSGTSGTETWIERQVDTVVRISIKSVAIATTDGGILEVAIAVGDAIAKGQDGPAAIETQLRVNQTVQVLVKAGERLAFKAYPTAHNAQLMRTVVWTLDLEDVHAHAQDAAKPDTGTQNTSKAA